MENLIFATREDDTHTDLADAVFELNDRAHGPRSIASAGYRPIDLIESLSAYASVLGFGVVNTR